MKQYKVETSDGRGIEVLYYPLTEHGARKLQERFFWANLTLLTEFEHFVRAEWVENDGWTRITVVPYEPS